MAETVDKETYKKIGNLLSTSHELIQKILHQMNFQDLVSVHKLSKTWQYYVKKVTQSHRELKYLTIFPETTPTSDLRVTIDKNLTTNAQLENFMETQPKKIEFFIAFFNEDFLDVSNIITKKTPNGVGIFDYLNNVLPESCDYTIVKGPGVIGSLKKEEMLSTVSTVDLDLNDGVASKENEAGSPDDHENEILITNTCSQCVEIEGSELNTEGFSMLALPQQPGVRVIKAVLSDSMFKNPDCISVAQVEAILGIDHTDQIVALVLLDADSQIGGNFADAVVTRSTHNVCIAGGIAKSVANRAGETAEAVVLAFVGPNVRAATITINRSMRTEERVETQLQQLKSAGIPEENSFAFLFTCCGRGSSMYKRFDSLNPNGHHCVETRAFRKSFPNTPVFGLQCYGEFGFLSLRPMPHSDASKRRRIAHNFRRLYSAVFLVIGIV